MKSSSQSPYRYLIAVGISFAAVVESWWVVSKLIPALSSQTGIMGAAHPRPRFPIYLAWLVMIAVLGSAALSWIKSKYAIGLFAICSLATFILALAAI